MSQVYPVDIYWTVLPTGLGCLGGSESSDEAVYCTSRRYNSRQANGPGHGSDGVEGQTALVVGGGKNAALFTGSLGLR